MDFLFRVRDFESIR